MKAKEFIPASKPRNLVAKNAPTSGAGRHKDSSKKKDLEQGKVKHKKDLVPMEGWSDAIVARRTGRPRTPYSVYIKGKKWKDFENDDHARAVMDKLKAKFKADGRDPETITIAPTDYDKMSESGLDKFNSPEQLKKDADYRAYRKGVKASRKQPPAPIKEFAPGGTMKPPAPPATKKRDPFGDDDRSQLLMSIKNLLDKGAKIDSYLFGARGHITGVANDYFGFYFKKLNKPHSKSSFVRPMDGQDDESYMLKLVKPGYYQLWDKSIADAGEHGVAEGIVDTIRSKNYARLADRSAAKRATASDNLDEPEHQKQTDIMKQRNLKSRLLNKEQGVAEGTGPQSKLDQKIIHLLTNGIPADAIARKLDIPVAWVDEVAEYNMPDSAIDYNDPRNTPPTNRFGEGVAEGSFAHDQLKGEINDLFKPVVLQIVKWARAEGMTAKDLAGTSSHFFLDALDPDTYDRTQHLPDNYFNKLMDKANAKAVEILKKKGVAEGAVNPQFINVQVTKILAREAQRMTNAPIEQLLAPLMKEYNLTVQQINSMIPGGLKKAAAEYGVMIKGVTEGESALEKFRKGSAEREKKHNDAEKEMKARHASGKEDMKGAIDRLEKHLNNK